MLDALCGWIASLCAAAPSEILKVHFVVDTSASMTALLPEVLDAARALIDEMPPHARIAFSTFNERIHLDYARTPKATFVLPTSLTCSRLTCVYDSLRTVLLHELCEDVVEHARVRRVVVMFTDGLNTAGTTTLASLRNDIHDYVCAGHSIKFVGAGIDAVELGATMGISRADSLSVSSGEIRGAFRQLSRAILLHERRADRDGASVAGDVRAGAQDAPSTCARADGARASDRGVPVAMGHDAR